MQPHHQIITLPPPPQRHSDHHELTSLHNHSNNTSSYSSFPSSSSHLPPSPSLESQTSRVVQIPPDQVFCRVLPPPPNNNNNIFSSPSPSSSSADHQNPYYNYGGNDDDTSSRRRSNCLASARTCIFLFFVMSILLVIIIVCVLYLSLNPKSPTFVIQSLSLKFSPPSSSSSPGNNSAEDYNIVACYYNLSMEACNPNSDIEFYYLQGGYASLCRNNSNQQEVAYGTPPEFYNGKNEVRVFDLLLNSTSEALSKVFAETIMKENNNGEDGKHYSRGKVPLVLFIRLPVKIKVGKLKLWTMKMKITCEVSISLSSSQDNNADLQPHYCTNSIH